MFGKSEADEPVLASRRHVKTESESSILGETLTFKGELSAEEDLFIQGRFEGSIHHNDYCLTIRPKGHVKADIRARVITVEGTVEGDLFGDERVVIRGTAKVRGNVTAPRVQLEEGANIRGGINTSAIDPQAEASEPPGLVTVGQGG